MKVLFICTGNTCRSPMAEGILNDLVMKRGINYKSVSVGIFAMDGGRAANNAIEAMRDIGLDISNHTSKSVSKELLEEADLILTMSKGHKDSLLSYYPHIKNKVFLLNEYAYGEKKDIEDPYGGNLDYYIKVRDEIYKAVEKILNNGSSIGEQ